MESAQNIDTPDGQAVNVDAVVRLFAVYFSEIALFALDISLKQMDQAW